MSAVAAAFGIDGCRGGWIAVAIAPDGSRAIAMLPRFACVAALGAADMLIDIPIGLPESGYRDCDRAARALLGAGRSRVFLGARRPLLGFGDYAAANGWAKSDGAGLSRQCWHILPKIAEIDRFITPARQAALREGHPELVFQRLNGGRPLPPKHSATGRRLRHGILAAAGFDALERWLPALRGRGARADDLYDACALALAARAPHGPIPCRAATDARGLRMEIWY